MGIADEGIDLVAEPRQSSGLDLERRIGITGEAGCRSPISAEGTRILARG